MKNFGLFPRSIPGGGKSSLSRLLKQMCDERGITCSIHSTDAKFYDETGVYKFEPNKVNLFHRLNYDEFCASTAKGTNLVILDNTNIVGSYFNYYVKNCQNMGYEMIDVVFYPDSIQKHFERNVHEVPFKNIQNMARKFDLNLQFGQKTRYEVFPDTWKMNTDNIANSIIQQILS